MIAKVLIFALIGSVIAAVCDKPQKSLYMSFHSMSKQDALPTVFNELSQNSTVRNAYYRNDNPASYNISNLKPQLFYSEHYQK